MLENPSIADRHLRPAPIQRLVASNFSGDSMRKQKAVTKQPWLDREPVQIKNPYDPVARQLSRFKSETCRNELGTPVRLHIGVAVRHPGIRSQAENVS